MISKNPPPRVRRKTLPSYKKIWSSPWVSLVQVPGKKGDRPYHGLLQRPYVGIVPILPGERTIVVRQYRPILRRHTWEFPAGTVDPGETPLQSARKELREETGLVGEKWIRLGSFFPDTGRLAMISYGFAATCRQFPRRKEWKIDGFLVRVVAVRELEQMMRNGTFRHQLHLGLWTAWKLIRKKV